MSKSRLELKVGIFVVIGLALIAVLMLQFSKGASLFRPTYTLYLTTQNVGGLQRNAKVLMSGVPVGVVSDIQLAPDGKTVTIVLAIYKKFVVHRDARFTIAQAGFLGDNYVAIKPTQNLGTPFQNGDSATAQEPFNLQEVARSAAGFIQRVDEAAKKLNDAISDVRRLVLNEETLTNLSSTVNAMRGASERALNTMDQINTLFATNGPGLSQSVSNLTFASEDLTRFTGTLNGILATNSDGITSSVSNIQSSTLVLKNILEDVQAGKGVAGTLLHNDQVAGQVENIVNNLSITTSNLNRLGLWGILWSKKPPRSDEPSASEPLKSPKYSH